MYYGIVQVENLIVCLFSRSFVRSFVHSFARSFVRLFAHSLFFVCSFVRLLIVSSSTSFPSLKRGCSFVCSFVSSRSFIYKPVIDCLT